MPSPREFFKKGYIASKEKNYDEAKQFYREALAIDPDYSMAWNNLGWILYDQDQNYKDAEDCYNKALKSDKNNFYAWNNYGILYYRQFKKYKKAERCWKKSSEIYSDFPLVWNNLGVLYKFQLKKPKKSKECFERAKNLSETKTKSMKKSFGGHSMKCVECGNKLEEKQHICDICGLEILKK